MEETRLRKLLESVESGALSVEEALDRLRVLPFEDLGFAKVDHHRALRRGFPEVIFCEGKTPEQIIKIAKGIVDQGVNLLATRCSREQFEALSKDLPEAEYHESGSIFAVVTAEPERNGRIVVVSGGTSDRQVAEEAALTGYYLGCNVDRLYDVGVAGIHRLLSHVDRIRNADVVIVVAGMEGALASVVAGIADAPIVAVPTSVGYGASFGGLSALLTMLNSCAGGVTVVNIDNGFGAGYAAAVICRKLQSPPADKTPRNRSKRRAAKRRTREKR